VLSKVSARVDAQSDCERTRTPTQHQAYLSRSMMARTSVVCRVSVYAVTNMSAKMETYTA
jgi:hypothetical protein